MRRPYQEQYAKGSCVRIASRLVLQQFLRDWKYHSKLQPEQLNYADQFAEVESIGFYHGGDELYELKGIRKCARSKQEIRRCGRRGVMISVINVTFVIFPISTAAKPCRACGKAGIARHCV